MIDERVTRARDHRAGNRETGLEPLESAVGNCERIGRVRGFYAGNCVEEAGAHDERVPSSRGQLREGPCTGNCVRVPCAGNCVRNERGRIFRVGNCAEAGAFNPRVGNCAGVPCAGNCVRVPCVGNCVRTGAIESSARETGRERVSSILRAGNREKERARVELEVERSGRETNRKPPASTRDRSIVRATVR